jgi:hypothetical protein
MGKATSFDGTGAVSIPCIEAFERQSNQYKNTGLPWSRPKRIAIEAGIPMPWYKYVGPDHVISGVDAFGHRDQPIDLINGFETALENMQNMICGLSYKLDYSCMKELKLLFFILKMMGLGIRSVRIPYVQKFLVKRS